MKSNGRPWNQFGQKVERISQMAQGMVAQGIVEFGPLEDRIKNLKTQLEDFITKQIDRAIEHRLKKVKVSIKKWPHFVGELPKYESLWSSGFDVRLQKTEAMTLEVGERVLVPTGLSFEIPSGFEIQARPRSGLAIKKGLSLVNTPGTIDADYRGEVQIILINLGQEPIVLNPQERIAQLVLCPIFQAEFVEVNELSPTDRGEGGFGHTGTN